jgi:hypothetical protein
MRDIRAMLIWFLTLISTTAMALPQTAQEPAQKAQEPELVVPAGTVLPVVLNTYLNTKNSQAGDTFYADTTYPVYIQQRLLIPRGSIIKGTVTQVVKAGSISGKGRLALRFDTILLPNGVERTLVANFHGIHGPGAEKIDRRTETVEQGDTGNKGAELGTVISTSGMGAIIGTEVSHSGANAGIGAGAGAAAGMAIVLLGRERNLILEPGIQLDLELRQPLRFAYGEVIFSQAEVQKAFRTPAARSTAARPKQQGRGGFGIPFFFPHIWR